MTIWQSCLQSEFHEEIMILTFISYNQNTNMLMWFQCSWWDFGSWALGLLMSIYQLHPCGSPHWPEKQVCGFLALPVHWLLHIQQKIVRFLGGCWHFSKWEIKLLWDLFLWVLCNNVVSVWMFSPVLRIDIWFFLEQGAGLYDLGKSLLIKIILWCFCIGKMVMPK